MKYKRTHPLYTELERLSVDQFVQTCSKMEKVSKRKRQWLSLIKADKLICPISNEKVDHVRKDTSLSNHGAIHYNFYTKDGDMMSVDHIIPKCKGGAEMAVGNLQPMVAYYNNRKGNKSMKQFIREIF